LEGKEGQRKREEGKRNSVENGIQEEEHEVNWREEDLK